ncbi:MAG: hypothetical protein KA004_12980 [Verrucomicrobiales bacterium]|nr:hypothetical protein [Verrucomicrobiales bacterium]
MKAIPSIYLLAAAAAALPAVRSEEAFYKEVAVKAATASKNEQRAVSGEEGWLFLNSELTHLGKGALTKEAVAPAVRQIAAFQKALAAKGANLLLLLVPAKAEIYPDKLASGFTPELLASRQSLLQADLQAAGVRSIDLASEFARRRKASGDSLLYCLRDAHWSPSGVEAAADLVSAAVKDAPWLKETTTQKLNLALSDPATLEIRGDLLGEPHTASLGAETIRLRYAGTKNGGTIEPAASAAGDSPVLLLGDSHTIVFSMGNDFHCRGAGLADHLQQRLGVPVGIVSSPGSGGDTARQQLARMAYRSPDIWKRLRLVVWCFSVREITEGRWRDIPLK